jgi:hypothetical protein
VTSTPIDMSCYFTHAYGIYMREIKPISEGIWGAVTVYWNLLYLAEL